MKTYIDLTSKKLKSFKPQDILYAEFAEGGAMGDCGSTRFYVIQDDTIKYYYTSVIKNPKNEQIWNEAYKLLQKSVEQHKLIQKDAGFGNYAFKNPKIKFVRDDDNDTFIYVLNNKKYKLAASCHGVYSRIAASFAAREIEIEELENYRKANFSHDSKRLERQFFYQYTNHLNRFDSGTSWFDISVNDYYLAIRYIKYLNKDDFILNEYELSDCEEAIQKYRLKYVIEKIGLNKLNAIFIKLVKKNKNNLFEEINKVLEENIEDTFTEIKTINSTWSKIRIIDPKNIKNLFKYPVLVNFSEEAHEKILENILKTKNLNPDAEAVSYYFANYLYNEDKLPYTKILPAVYHVIENLPNNDFNHTNTDQLFWLAGEIIDRCWRYIDEEEDTQEKFRDLVYKLYWPRIGSLWPIVHYSEFEFKYESADKIFRDSLGFICALSDLTERNPEIKRFAEFAAEKIDYSEGPLERRLFYCTLQDSSAKKNFERIFKIVKPEDFYSFLDRPETTEEADLILGELFNRSHTSKIPLSEKLGIIEKLFLTPNAINIGEYLLNFVDKHFDEFIELTAPENYNLTESHNDILTGLFLAMSLGVTEENEFPPLNSIAKKLINSGCDKETIEAAKKYARKHRRTILFQRSDLKKLF